MVNKSRQKKAGQAVGCVEIRYLYKASTKWSSKPANTYMVTGGPGVGRVYLNNIKAEQHK